MTNRTKILITIILTILINIYAYNERHSFKLFGGEILIIPFCYLSMWVFPMLMRILIEEFNESEEE